MSALAFLMILCGLRTAGPIHFRNAPPELRDRVLDIRRSQKPVEIPTIYIYPVPERIEA